MKACAIVLVVVVLSVACAQNLLETGGFEGEYGADGVAPGWKDNSYSSKGPLGITYARETENTRAGEACQRMTCTRIGYISTERTGHAFHGAWQMPGVKDLPLRKGAIYRIRASVRSDRPMPVEILLRLRPEPWTKYLTYDLLTAEEWTDVDLLWESHVDDPASAFFVRSEYLGTIWVDECSVEELSFSDARKVAGPVTPGNLLRNPDFDLGRVNWMGERGWETLEDANYTVEEIDGNPCIRLEIGATYRKALRSDAVPVTQGAPLIVSCRARAEKPCEVSISAHYETDGFALPAYCKTTKQVGTQWETLEARGTVPFIPDANHAFVDIIFPGPGPVWVDDVTLRQAEGEAPEAARAAIAPDRHPWGLYHDGDPVSVGLMTSVPEGREVPMRWSIEDYRGEVVRSGQLRAQPGRTRTDLDVSDLGRGYYHATIEWADLGRRFRNESTFCILPPPERAGDGRASFFGGHYQYSPANTNLANAVGSRWVRLWPPGLTLWKNVEPQKGQWKWRDAEVQRFLDSGLTILGMLESPPSWVKWNSETYWQEWETYAANVVEHYKGRIDHWEIQNEPNLQWWWLEKPEGGKRAEWYFQALKRLYPVVKRVNPRATVYGGCIGGDFAAGTDHLAFTEELIKLGGLQYMDTLSFHYYHTYAMPMPLDEMPDPIADSIARMKQSMRDAGRELPIANTEGGTYNPAPAITYRIPGPVNFAPIPPSEVARLMVRQNVSQWAAGIERFIYYNCFINGSALARAWDSFVEGDGQPRPAVAAYAAMTWLLDGGTFERTERIGQDVWLHHFRTDRGHVVVAWTRTGTAFRHAFPGATQAWDMVGREFALTDGRIRLTPDPVYVLLPD